MKKQKIPVAILGATGMVGQMFVQLLENHPWFEIVALAASERSEGKTYKEATKWVMESPLPQNIASMKVAPCIPNLPCKIVFSGLDSSVAGEIEETFAKAKYLVLSNSKNHRMDPYVPLLVPEINADHLKLNAMQPYLGGAIVTNPNCSVIGLVMALKPLLDRWGLKKVNVVTMQALSGAGYPGVSAYDILDNVVPFISDEENKLETEPQKILGTFVDSMIEPHPMMISASCNRVACKHGHLECVSVKLNEQATISEIIQEWNHYLSLPQKLSLPSAPQNPIVYFHEETYPQPKLHRDLGKGMAVSVGRLRKCPILDWKFLVLSHNLIRGAAGCAILNAEMMVKMKMV